MPHLLTPAAVIVARTQLGYPRPRIVANHDPLRNVPQGDFRLDDYSFEGADLCQREFGNCALPALNVVA